jgi:hypothetical protein
VASKRHGQDLPNRGERRDGKVCGNTFDDRDGLNQHLAGLHHPKRTVTASDILNGVFEGRMNFPKTKAEIAKYVKDNKDRPATIAEVIDTVRSICQTSSITMKLT